MNLWNSPQVNSAVGLGHRLVIDEQLKITVVFLGGEVHAVAVVDQFLTINGPVFRNILEARSLLFREFLGREGHPLGRIFGLETPPTRQILFIK